MGAKKLPRRSVERSSAMSRDVRSIARRARPAGPLGRPRSATSSKLDWLDELYEAAGDLTRWSCALSALAEHLGASRVALEVFDSSRGDTLFVAVSHGRAGRRPAASSARRGGNSGAAAAGAASFRFDGGVAWVELPHVGARATTFVVVERGRGAPPWRQNDRTRLRPVLRHLERALRLTLRLGSSAETAPTGPVSAWPDLGPEAEASLVRSRGLTPAEARVAVRMARGSSTARVARELGVSLETVRTHLKRIYAKLGTTRQADLVRILLTRTRAGQ